MLNIKLSRRDWMKLIEEFMVANDQPVWNWDQVLQYEGGYGENKIHSIEEALLENNSKNLPGIWFQSGQKDLTEYGKYSYVYSALFGRDISSPTFNAMRYHFPKIKDNPLMFDNLGDGGISFIDYGGTIFTSVQLLRYFPSIKDIKIMNIESPQTTFAQFIISKLQIPNISVHNEYEIPANGNRTIVIFSEVLEHINNPEKQVKRFLDAGYKEFYIANSFCTPSYGHYCPIKIADIPYHTTRKANKAFAEEVKKLGLYMEKVEGFNSRLFYCRPPSPIESVLPHNEI